MELEEAVKLFADKVKHTNQIEETGLVECHGRILAEDIKAPFNVPHFPKSAMDGYAVRSEDISSASEDEPVRLAVIGKILAGCDMIPYEDSGMMTGKSSTCVRIMTGADIPEGYDTIVKQEDTDYGEKSVAVKCALPPYMNYCRIGEDISEGDTVIKAGIRIGRVHVGILASLGISSVRVLKPLRVSVISTGSELCDPTVSGSIPTKGKIYNSIAYMLSASVESVGFEAKTFMCPDEPDIITDAINKAASSSDIIITTGGVSVGERDLMPDIMESIGAQRVFYKVNIQPGTPTLGSIYKGIPVLSLSGNPYAALVNFDWYFWNLAASMTGCSELLPKVENVISRSDYRKKNHMRRFLRAWTENGTVSIPVKNHASSVLSSITKCNCYIDLPAQTELGEGDTVKVIRMPDVM